MFPTILEFIENVETNIFSDTGMIFSGASPRRPRGRAPMSVKPTKPHVIILPGNLHTPVKIYIDESGDLGFTQTLVAVLRYRRHHRS
jgi:hypothetical protein